MKSPKILGSRCRLIGLFLLCLPVLSLSFGFGQFENALQRKGQRTGPIPVFSDRRTASGRTKAFASHLFVNEARGDSDNNGHLPIIQSRGLSSLRGVLSKIAVAARQQARSIVLMASALAMFPRINPRAAVAAASGSPIEASSSIVKFALGVQGGATAVARKNVISALAAGTVVIGVVGGGKLLGKARRSRDVELARQQPKSDAEEKELADKYAAMDLEDRAFSILLDLGMVEKTPDP